MRYAVCVTLAPSAAWLFKVYILMGQGKDALRSVKQGLSAMRARGGKKILEAGIHRMPLLIALFWWYQLIYSDLLGILITHNRDTHGF